MHRNSDRESRTQAVRRVPRVPSSPTVLPCADRSRLTFQRLGSASRPEISASCRLPLRRSSSAHSARPAIGPAGPSSARLGGIQAGRSDSERCPIVAQIRPAVSTSTDRGTRCRGGYRRRTFVSGPTSKQVNRLSPPSTPAAIPLRWATWTTHRNLGAPPIKDAD